MNACACPREYQPASQALHISAFGDVGPRRGRLGTPNAIPYTLWTRPWYSYLACFFAGAFLANVVPHFVHGISGGRFPTPFAKPPGKGLSSPIVNTLWALLNLPIGYLLPRRPRLAGQPRVPVHLLRRHRRHQPHGRPEFPAQTHSK